MPWDPGGFTWRRLEVKPKIKEGGMLATFPPLALDVPWASSNGLGLLGKHGVANYKYKGNCYEQRRLGLGRLWPPRF